MAHAPVFGLIRAALEALGTTPDAIARTLHAEGVTGYRESPYCCPLANYLHARLLACGVEVCGIEVTDYEIIVDLADGSAVTVATPRPVAFFVNQFDGGAYWRLVPLGHAA
jgi:hypothetical protein